MPKGAQGHLLLFPLLELLVGSVQICKHLQQAGSCRSLLGQGIRAGPYEGDREPRGLSQAGWVAITQTQRLSQAPDWP